MSKDRFGKQSWTIGIKEAKKVDFPSKDIWIGVSTIYALELNKEQLKDLHAKIHVLFKENFPEEVLLFR